MSPYPMSPEQAVLFQAARMTWLRRGAFKTRNLPFHEESVTETILQDLVLQFPGELLLVPFNKIQEGQNGADWAWAFESADRSRAFGMLVQAKVLDLDDKDYAKIDQKAGKTAAAKKQIDLLQKTAADWGVPAVYAFYNHLDEPNRIPDVCATFPRQAPNFPVESWGISIAAADNVRAALPDKSFDTHRLHSIPLHCLLCSGGRGLRPKGGSPEAALAAWDRLNPRPSRGSVSGAAEETVSFAIDGFDAEFDERLYRPLPNVFALARDLAGIQSEAVRENLVAGIRESHPNLAGVVIMTDSNASS